MAKKFFNDSTQRWQDWPSTLENAKELNYRRYISGETCPTCDVKASTYVNTGLCHNCQSIKSRALYALVYADYRWNHDTLECRTDACVVSHMQPECKSLCDRETPCHNVYRPDLETYMELIELRDMVLNNLGMVVKHQPCKSHGHISIELNDRCVECAKPSPRQYALMNDLPTYDGKPCVKCKGVQRHTGSSLCVTCGQVAKQLSPRASAIEAGRAWYMPDSPCAKCDTTSLKRVNNGQCQGCKKPAT